VIRDLERELPGAQEAAEGCDVCVIGAGAAGIALAVELVRLGRRVMLLEAGGGTIEEASQEPYRSEVVGHVHRGIHSGRFRAQGGTTTRWGGQILELDAIDFERRDWVSGSSWPFAKSELTAGYARALELEGMSGVVLEDAEVWRQLGQPEPRFDGLVSYLSRWTPEPNFAVLHRRTLEGDGVAVWLHANAVGLEMEGEAVRGVRVKTLGGREAIFRAWRFVFCLGAIESSRFFLQPRDGGLPWNPSGLLGRHFQDHIDCNAAELRVTDRRAFHRMFDNIYLDGWKYHTKVKVATDAMRDRALLNAGATMCFLSGLDVQMAELKIAAKKVLRGGMKELSTRDLLQAGRSLPLLARQAWRYGMSHRAYNPASARVMLRVHCEQEPLSASSITLCDERDSLGMLRTRLEWRISSFERRAILEFARLAKCALAGVAELTLDPDLERCDPAFLAWCDDSNHHMGGMRMAVVDSQGVVDPDLRLFGTRNCYVCSGAVFPTSGFSNPTHTLLALAVRLAGHLNRH
jgi:choline dehydrogenase-like flavoprotein